MTTTTTSTTTTAPATTTTAPATTTTTSTTLPDDDGKVTLCHKGKNTISVGAKAAEKHVEKHGDTLGSCDDD